MAEREIITMIPVWDIRPEVNEMKRHSALVRTAASTVLRTSAVRREPCYA